MSPLLLLPTETPYPFLESLRDRVCSGFRGAILHDQAPGQLWTPLPGPQTEALLSDADELLFGGQAGGGKTDLPLGLAYLHHQSAVIFRRELMQTRDMVKRSRELFEGWGRYNQTERIWRFPGGKTLEFGGLEHEGSWLGWKGRPHDLLWFDELTEILEIQYLALRAWARTTIPGQRVRLGGGTNPPTGPEGEWVIRRWAAWLDDQHPDPAMPGELRWYATVEGIDRECDGPRPFVFKGELIAPTSRTFIPARLDQNPYLDSDGRYRAMLQGLPEPFRSQLLYGDWSIGQQDQEWQVVPASWVRLAQARWTDARPRNEYDEPLSLSQIGMDVAQGGKDRTVIQKRYGRWFARPEVTAGSDSPDAEVAMKLLQLALADSGGQAVAVIDADGIGSSTYFLAAALGLNVRPFRGAATTTLRDDSKTLDFANLRAAAHWQLRQALNPANNYGYALPPDRDIRVELCASTYQLKASGIIIEKKEDVKKRLGRSPDVGDACVLALWRDPRWALQEGAGRVARLQTHRGSNGHANGHANGHGEDPFIVATRRKG